MMITDRINAAREALKNMGRDEIRKAHEAGLSASYTESSDGAITREYPDGTKIVTPVVEESDAAETARRSLGSR